MTARNQFGGQTMVGRLRRVLVCSPRAAGWFHVEQSEQWRELGYLRAPDAEKAEQQHAALCRALEAAGAELVQLDSSEELSLDAVYTHDASFPTDHGLIQLNMGKSCRRDEPRLHGELFRRTGVAVLGEITPPGTVEGGDLLWLDSKTVLAGRGYRTNAAGIEQLRALLAPRGVEVISAPLPHGTGPQACLHLMSLISLLNEDTALVDSPWLAVETVEVLRARGYRMIEIDASERATLACNVLALGAGRLLAFEENVKTNERLRAAGFAVAAVAGSEIGINGGGGPTCLTRPLWREH